MTAIIQRSLAGGELGPSLYARVDTIKYQTGLRTCRNWLILKEGGASNRPGTEYVCEVKDSSKKIVKIPFIFNDDQTYVLEFGNLYMRVIRNGVQLTVTGSAWSALTNYVVGDVVAVAGTNYYCILAHINHTPPNATYWYAMTGSIYEIPTPYVEADLPALKYNQSADVITLTHKSYAVRELARTGHTTWTLSLVTFAPAQVAPTSPSNNGGGAGSAASWVITALNSESFEESLQSSATTSAAAPTSGSPITVSWTGASGAGQYNIYKLTNGVYGFIGVAIGTSFVDNGIEADATDTPPTARNPFASSGDYPATSAYVQERLTFGDNTNDPEKVWMGKSANFKNFTTSTPLQDDDAVTFNLAGTRVNEVRHIIDFQQMLVFTSGSIKSIEGDSAGIIRPGQVNPKTRAVRGASIVTPIIVGTSIVYVQARGAVIRDLLIDAIRGYTESDLTIFASHLFKGYTIIDMAYQENPNSIIWVIREKVSTGVRSLIGLTYVKEHQVWAWHRHDSDGQPERVCVVPEGDEDFLYLTVKRTINSSTKRYIERMASRQIDDVIDNIFMDCSLSFDGRNTDGTKTMTLSGSGWTYTDTLTLTSNSAYFVIGDIGNEIQLTGSDGTLIRCTITAYTSSTVVSVRPNKTVPVSMQAVAISDWAKAVDTLSGLSHLEGKELAVFADRFVVASPNNSSYETVTVTAGVATLERPYVVIHAGLPFISDLETLDIDTVNGQTMVDKKKLIGKVVMQVEDTRGLFVGNEPPSDDDTDPLENLNEVKLRDAEGYDEAVDLVTGPIDVVIATDWNSNGRVFIRQVDPIPASVLSITPVGMVPLGR